MRLILTNTPKTGMAIINDTGEAKDIHPKNKKDPGERLALWALAKDYGKDLKVWSGPLYRAAQTRDGAIRVAFDQAGSGLKSRDGGPLKRFEIAGQDQAWHWADAKVDGTDGVLVSSPAVPKPVAVRYAWASNPEGANLVNSEGLPASVFRTDDWKDVEAVPVDPAAEALKAKRALGVKVREFAAKRDTLERSPEALPHPWHRGHQQVVRPRKSSRTSSVRQTRLGQSPPSRQRWFISHESGRSPQFVPMTRRASRETRRVSFQIASIRSSASRPDGVCGGIRNCQQISSAIQLPMPGNPRWSRRRVFTGVFGKRRTNP
jgi:hypothetical protein